LLENPSLPKLLAYSIHLLLSFIHSIKRQGISFSENRQ
jgi:hypothetical protein